MLTNMIEESTELICEGSEAKELIKVAFQVDEHEGSYHLEKVVSRKKQLVPKLMSVMQQE